MIAEPCKDWDETWEGNLIFRLQTKTKIYHNIWSPEAALQFQILSLIP